MGYKILSKKEICPNQYEITIDAPYVVRNAQAGQFIIFRADKNGERVPLTIADVNKETGALTLVFMAVGYSTKRLASLGVGDEIADIVKRTPKLIEWANSIAEYALNQAVNNNKD